MAKGNKEQRAIRRHWKKCNGWLAGPTDENQELFAPDTRVRCIFMSDWSWPADTSFSQRWQEIKAKIDKGPPYSQASRKEKRPGSSFVRAQQQQPLDPIALQQERDRREETRRDKEARHRRELEVKRYDIELERLCLGARMLGTWINRNNLPSFPPEASVRTPTPIQTPPQTGPYPETETPAPLEQSLAGERSSIAATVAGYVENKKLDLHGLVINRKTFDVIRNECFNSHTFLLLSTITQIPRSWIVHISDDPALEHRPWVQNIGCICFAGGAPKRVGHWFLIHVDLRGETMCCYDALHDPSSLMSEQHYEMHAKVVGMLEKANMKSRRLASELMVAKRSIRQLDAISCGPLAWRELEILMDGVIPRDETATDLRERLLSQVAFAAATDARNFVAASYNEVEFLHQQPRPPDELKPLAPVEATPPTPPTNDRAHDDALVEVEATPRPPPTNKRAYGDDAEAVGTRRSNRGKVERRIPLNPSGTDENTNFAHPDPDDHAMVQHSLKSKPENATLTIDPRLLMAGSMALRQSIENNDDVSPIYDGRGGTSISSTMQVAQPVIPWVHSPSAATTTRPFLDEGHSVSCRRPSDAWTAADKRLILRVADANVKFAKKTVHVIIGKL
ncbi:MAG: hypothetical protein Q9207_001444 [Kuettlingeria erythrocarpa]